MTDHNPTGNEAHGLTVGELRGLLDGLPDEANVLVRVWDSYNERHADVFALALDVFYLAGRGVTSVTVWPENDGDL